MDGFENFFLLGWLYTDALQGFSGAAVRADEGGAVRPRKGRRTVVGFTTAWANFKFSDFCFHIQMPPLILAVLLQENAHQIQS